MNIIDDQYTEMSIRIRNVASLSALQRGDIASSITLLEMSIDDLKSIALYRKEQQEKTGVKPD